MAVPTYQDWRSRKPFALAGWPDTGAVPALRAHDAGSCQLRHSTSGKERNMKLNVKAFALTLGIVWGLGLFALTWWIILFDGITHDATPLGQLYRGYNISPVGSVIGLV
jgi:hypothetical protein